MCHVRELDRRLGKLGRSPVFQKLGIRVDVATRPAINLRRLSELLLDFLGRDHFFLPVGVLPLSYSTRVASIDLQNSLKRGKCEKIVNHHAIDHRDRSRSGVGVGRGTMGSKGFELNNDFVDESLSFFPVRPIAHQLNINLRGNLAQLGCLGLLVMPSYSKAQGRV